MTSVLRFSRLYSRASVIGQRADAIVPDYVKSLSFPEFFECAQTLVPGHVRSHEKHSEQEPYDRHIKLYLK